MTTSGWGRVRYGRLLHYFSEVRYNHGATKGLGRPECRVVTRTSRISPVGLPLLNFIPASHRRVCRRCRILES